MKAERPPRKIDSISSYRIPDEDPDAVSFFASINKTFPSYYRLNIPLLYNQAVAIIKKNMSDATLQWEFEDGYLRMALYQASFNSHEILVRIKRSYVANKDNYDLHNGYEKYLDEKGRFLITPEIEIMYDVRKGRPDKLIKAFEAVQLKDNRQNNKISLICQDPEIGLYTKDFPMKAENYNFDLNLHYGDDFTRFHDLNVRKIDNSEKGIILLQGPPGTGKSYYLRRLVCDLMKNNKKILYLPTGMVDILSTPTFNDFLLDTVESKNDEEDYGDVPHKKGIVLIIEDAEKVLLRRDNNPHLADGVSNILNSTDGILNDILNIQVICTFNCDLNQIDQAILRKKRVISLKEFKALPKESAQKLINHLGIKYKATDEMTLADIFSIEDGKDDDVILADINNNKNKNSIGFKK